MSVTSFMVYMRLIKIHDCLRRTVFIKSLRDSTGNALPILVDDGVVKFRVAHTTNATVGPFPTYLIDFGYKVNKELARHSIIELFGTHKVIVKCEEHRSIHGGSPVTRELLDKVLQYQTHFRLRKSEGERDIEVGSEIDGAAKALWDEILPSVQKMVAVALIPQLVSSCECPRPWIPFR